MKKSLLFLMLGVLSTGLLAYSDADMDGVEDRADKCPNTSLMDLVDINGCSKESLISNNHFDIIVGASYAESDYKSLNTTDTLSSTLQVDYYHKNFSIQASTAYFTTDGSGYRDSGMQDSYLGASYQFKPSDSLSLRVGAVAILPTYDSALNNNNTDYSGSLNLSYSLNNLNIFGGYIYTLINDDDTVSNGTPINYQNTNAYNIGLGYYFTKKLYVSGAYNSSMSIYKDVDDINTASVYTYYSIDEHWFTTFNYAYGISDTASKNYAALRLGYFF